MHGRSVGELVVAGLQEPFDGLGGEHAVELAAQPGGGGAQGVLLVEGEAVEVGHGVTPMCEDGTG